MNTYTTHYGDTIDTLDGSITVISTSNGSTLKCEVFELDECNEMHYIGEQLFTKDEIRHILKDTGYSFDRVTFDEDAGDCFTFSPDHADRSFGSNLYDPYWIVNSSDINELARDWSCTVTEVLSLCNPIGYVRDYDCFVSCMDDDIREYVHMDMAPCSDAAFLREYQIRHLEKYGKELTI